MAVVTVCSDIRVQENKICYTVHMKSQLSLFIVKLLGIVRSAQLSGDTIPLTVFNQP